MPTDDLIDERLKNLSDVINKITTQLENLAKCVNALTVSFSKIEHLPTQVDILSKEFATLNTKVSIIESQTLVPLREVSKGLGELRGKIGILENDSLYNKGNWKNLLSHSAHMFVTVMAAVLGYLFAAWLK